MLDPAIAEFFTERKQAWLKKNLNSKMDEAQRRATEQECEQVFALSNWLPNAAKRAGQISISTHPCTFSHPSARKNKNGYVSSIIAKVAGQADGYLRAGNVNVEPDALGNAAALDVYKFLTLTVDDGHKLLSHIEQQTLLSKVLLEPAGNYHELRNGFLQMIAADANVVTSSKIKQVYFPLNEGGYHQLSLLTNSGLLFEMRSRIRRLRFQDEQGKQAKELKRKGEYSEHGFSEIYGITTMGYGGTKPQNISVLNNQNGGKAHLLLSAPPSFQAREVRVPQTHFFADSINPWQMKECFYAYHQILRRVHNTKAVRDDRDRWVQEYLDRVILTMWQLRVFLRNNADIRPQSLPMEQQIWLLPEHEARRDTEQEWLHTITVQLSKSFIAGYHKVLGNKAIRLGDAEFEQVHKIIKQQSEGLR